LFSYVLLPKTPKPHVDVYFLGAIDNRDIFI